MSDKKIKNKFKVDDNVFIIDTCCSRPSQGELEIRGPYSFIAYEPKEEKDDDIRCLVGQYSDPESYLAKHLFTEEEARKMLDIWFKAHKSEEWERKWYEYELDDKNIEDL